MTRIVNAKMLIGASLAIAALATGLVWWSNQGAADAARPEVTSSNLNPPGADEVHLSPEDVSAASANLSDFQRSLIADGRLTFAEYESAFRSYVACLERAGGRIESPPTLTKRRTFTARIALPAGDDPARAAGAIDACRREYLSLADQLWTMHNAVSQETLAEARVAFAACLRAGGATEVPEKPAPGEMVEYWPGHERGVDPKLFVACQAETEEKFGIPGVSGA